MLLGKGTNNFNAPLRVNSRVPGVLHARPDSRASHTATFTYTVSSSSVTGAHLLRVRPAPPDTHAGGNQKDRGISHSYVHTTSHGQEDHLLSSQPLPTAPSRDPSSPAITQ